MSQQSQRTSSLSPADLPMKRKRGRPRKGENLMLGKNKSMTPASASTRKNKESGDISDDADGAMVGQVVTGVIEGSFDAGYLLNVKVGDTDTHLRGVAFLPGRFTPITAANDVAPHVKMYDRKEIPIPVLNHQTQLHISVLPSGQSSKQPTRLKTHAPELSDQLHSPGLQSAIPNAPENLSASVMVTVAANSPKNDASLSLGGNEVPQKTSEPGLVSQSTSTVAQPDHDETVEHDEVLEECEVSPLIEGANHDGEATKESKAESASEPVVDMIPATEIATKEPQIQHQAVSLDLKPNELVHDEVKNPNLELNHTFVFAEPSEQMNKLTDIVMEEHAPPEKDIAEETQLEPAIEISSGTATSLSNGRPASDPLNATELGSHSPPQSSQPAMMSEGEAIPSESNQPTSKESALPGMMEPQLHSSGTRSYMENGVKDDPVPQS
ncbi:hypothetical protein I3760_10G069400 [Carya illinoinensis]|uniref:AT hook motif-containing protein n=1 Tax=Carya illinoinensis TaxID=32201 RepID=A0A8T1PBC7_CARIL|nr:uncharacterized protein LOC122280020 [Carya illinoinensis]XP_042946898.1 uncharacterized protein LOC122280020 [Carya illinoinensis]XP_042946899.1 uncharacterized protein LOC122280020 [Carya illinoinensis]XP_042946900.1 uncharacterized protein LOC122280020 [Carya illinoinensis]XP_042946901.1 uncharacterized protein LOC122280020 [Carya illinoinensis]XP_042946902.1 uncharacterized protein LOC122280020 [Carya illinoinensis]KAG2684272.1 hypothetical protein I3760_10G069400 [Carya illinoinensis]